MTLEQAHQNLKNVLLNGRVLINGMPLTANELSGLLQGEQLLYEKAVEAERHNQAAKDAPITPKTPEKTPKKKE